ncbi:FlxA-like family protein [Peribacillus sp. NPDC097295]|uniref:FlxA-like family protein n=1 Tax=Peribacillus sp. NPDC097295 TaxID=3364402 RepID=UPI0038275D36
MQISSSTNNYATNTNGTSRSSQSAINDLEQEKAELQADIQEAYQSDDTAEAKQEKVQQLQKEMQQLSMQIQQLQAEENKGATQVKVTTPKQKDSLEISDRTNLLFAQSKEDE